MMTAYINIKGDKSESEKKKKYIFILFKITKKGLITFITKRKNQSGGKTGIHIKLSTQVWGFMLTV